MNTTIGNRHPASNGASELIESLIIGYLDAGINESDEAQLFASLANDHSARALLREHLVIRGVIQDLAASDLFVLSTELDQRTRTKLEALVYAMPLLAPQELLTRLPDRTLIHAEATKRSLDRWKVRPQYALLLLLLAVVGTWGITISLNNSSEKGQVAVNQQPVASQENSNSTLAPEAAAKTVEQQFAQTDESSMKQTEALSANLTTKTSKPSLISAGRKQRSSSPSQRYKAPTAKENRFAEVTENPEASQPSNMQPADIMISQRFSRILKNTNAIAITPRDRISSGRNGGL